MRSYLHREVHMAVIVGQYVSHGLVQHGEQGSKSAEASVIHDVLQGLPELETFADETVGCEERLEYSCTLALYLERRENKSIHKIKILQKNDFYSMHCANK